VTARDAASNTGTDSLTITYTTQSCVNTAGTWYTTEHVNATACGEGYYYDYKTYVVTQNLCSITVAAGGSTFYGTINGNTLSWSGSYPDEGGTITLTVSLTTNNAGDYFSGSSSWTWSDGFDSCSGTTSVTGNKY
jgi:hypothetical protein